MGEVLYVVSGFVFVVRQMCCNVLFVCLFCLPVYVQVIHPKSNATVNVMFTPPAVEDVIVEESYTSYALGYLSLYSEEVGIIVLGSCIKTAYRYP